MRFFRLLISVHFLLALPVSSAFAQEDARVQQYVQMLQPTLWRELEFVRQVCDLAPEQRPKIKTAADAAVKEAAKAMTKPQRQPMTMAGATILRDGVRESLKKTLTPEQLDRFTSEDAARATATKEAAVAGLVSHLDGTLFLNQEQREKITADLQSHWEPEWEHWLTMYQHAAQYVPQVPDQYVSPHLNADQKVVWDGLQKVMINYWVNGPRQPDEAWWNGKDPAAKAKVIKAKAVAPAKKAQ